MLDMKDFRIEFDQAKLVQSVLGILQALEIFCYFRRVQALAQVTSISFIKANQFNIIWQC